MKVLNNAATRFFGDVKKRKVNGGDAVFASDIDAVVDANTVDVGTNNDAVSLQENENNIQ